MSYNLKRKFPNYFLNCGRDCSVVGKECEMSNDTCPNHETKQSCMFDYKCDWYLNTACIMKENLCSNNCKLNKNGRCIRKSF